MKEIIYIWCRHCCEVHDAKLIIDPSGVKHYDTDCGIIVFVFPEEGDIPPRSKQMRTSDESGDKNE